MQDLQDMLTVLSAVHAQHVIHRDIKPSNILRRQGDRQTPDQLVLIDFGAVKALQTSPSQDVTVAIGSLGYMAPEQQAARPCFGSDLYSLGMVMLQALSGRHPMSFETPTTCARLGVNVSETLAGFIDRLVQVDHRERYSSAGEALRVFQTWFSDRGPAVGSSSMGDTSRESHRADFMGVAPTVPTPVKTTERPSTASLPVSPYSQQTYRNRRALLNKVRHFWIDGVLNRSLHGQVLLKLGLEERPDEIAPPWQVTYATPGQSPQPLPAGTQVGHVFDALGEGRTLLILGEPGAGKTTTLLTLAQKLVEQDQETQRLPVVFNLSSWQHGPIETWLAKELNSKYQVPKAIGRCWVNEQQLVLLLDGLDEVASDRRAACVEALNQFHQTYGPEMVVCCRMGDYEILPTKLQFQAALYLRPLTNHQILSFLNRPDRGLTGLTFLLEQNSVVQDATPSLMDLARSPLILNIMVLTYQGVASEEILQLGQDKAHKDYQHRLFDAYIQRMLAHRPQPFRHSQHGTVRSAFRSNIYSTAQIKGWLTALAKRLVTTSQTVFLIERIQPDWLETKLRRLYILGLWCSFFAIATPLGAQVLALDRLLLAVALGGLICRRIFGVSHITPAETLRWSWRKARNNLLLGLTLGPPIGWCLKVGFGFIFGDSVCLSNGSCLVNHSVIGLSFGVTLGITFGLIRGFSGKRIGNTSCPNAGIWQSARSATLFALVAMVALYVPGFLLGNTKASFWAATGLAFGFAAGGGEALIKHLLLRIILTLTGAIPWNYGKFLDYAADILFLQKVGGGYIFIHRLLLEHFASLPTERE